MSYQYITKGTFTPGTPPPGSASRVHSHSIPHALLQELTSLYLPLKEIAAADMTGPHYSYRQVISAATSFHVLSSIHYFAVDGRYIAHFLALTEDEVQALRRNASRPTPAGVIMALDKVGLWETGAGDAIDVEQEPRLTAAALPDASVQPTWKRLTGHKNNARAFFSAPYDRECVVTVAPETSTEDILLLCHESDWLSSTRGWGKTFTTLGSTHDTHQEFTRIFTTTNSRIAATARSQGTVVLAINAELELAQQVDNPPAAAPQQRKSTGFALPTDSGATPASPYKYTETPDEDVFNILPKPKRWVRWACVLGGVSILWCGSSLISGFFIDDAVEITGQLVSNINIKEDIQLLAELTSSGYSAQTTGRKLDQLEAHITALPSNEAIDRRYGILKECVQLLRSASADASGHPDNLIRLYECAEALKLSPEALCRLYLHEATHDRLLDEWLSSCSQKEEQEDWAQLLERRPQIISVLQEASIRPYMEGILGKSPAPTPEPPPAPPAPAEPTAEQASAPETAPQEAPSVAPVRVALAPELIMSGDELPVFLKRYFTTETKELRALEYQAVPVGVNPYPHLLASETRQNTSLLISPDKTADTWILSIKDNPNIPSISLSFNKNGELEHISSNGIQTAIKLQATDENNHICTYLLIPRIEIPVQGIIAHLPPKADADELRISANMLVQESPSPQAPNGKLVLKKSFAAAPFHGEVPVSIQPQLRLNLPQFTTENNLVATQSHRKDNATYSWKHKHVTSNIPHTDTWECTISRKYNFEAPIQNTFTQVANLNCCGERPDGDARYSVASLYSIVNENAIIKQQLDTNELVNRYYSLHIDKRFARQLRLILENEQYMHLSYDELNNRGATHNQARTRIAKNLKNPKIRKILRNSICDMLTRSATQAYEEAYKRQSSVGNVVLILRLERVTLGPVGELNWYFTLQPSIP